MRWINKIIVHCSDSPAGRNDKAADIDRWHKEKGWKKKIGYHYVVDLDGKIEKGREDWEVGAHCKGQNLHSIGVCYIGGGEEKTQGHQPKKNHCTLFLFWAWWANTTARYSDTEILRKKNVRVSMQRKNTKKFLIRSK